MSGTGAGAAVVLPALGAVLQAAPSPSDGGELNSVTVSPGLPGFFAAFVLAVAVVLLAVDMTRRVRRVQAKARVEERYAELEREETARQGAEEPEAEEPEPEGSADEGPAGADPADPAGTGSAGGDSVGTEQTDADPDDSPDGPEDSGPEADERR